MSVVWKTRPTYNINQVRYIFEKEGYQLISKTYKNNRTPLEVVCPNGHATSIQFGNFQQGTRCRFCQVKTGRPINIKKAHKQIISAGYVIISEYSGAKKPMVLECPSGHRFSVTWTHWKAGQRCPSCSELEKFKYRVRQR